MDLELIQPTQLYNILNQSLHHAFISNPFYLVLYDVRSRREYNESHIVLSKLLKKDEVGNFILPKEAELECRWNVVVYDVNTSKLDGNSLAIIAGNFLYEKGSRKKVKVLKGGYEEFSRKYPFMRSQQKFYLPRELESYVTYPLEVIPGFLYLSSRDRADDGKMHRELNITAHVNCDMKEDPLYANCSAENMIFSIGIDTNAELFPFLDEACEFLQEKRFQGCRVLLISTYSINRNVVVAIAYLIKYTGMSLKDSWQHLKDVCLPMQPTWSYMQELAKFEAQCRGRKSVTPLTEEEYYGEEMRAFKPESQILSALPRNNLES